MVSLSDAIECVLSIAISTNVKFTLFISRQRNAIHNSALFSRHDLYTRVALSPAYILTISQRFTVAPCVFTQRLLKTIRRINSRLRRRCVNTGGRP